MRFLDSWALKRTRNLFNSKSINLKDPKNFQRAFDDYFHLTTNPNTYVGAAFSAIDTWGLYFAKANFRVYKKENGDAIEVNDKRLLFDDPNPYQVWWEMAYILAAQFGLFGKSYIYKKRTQPNPKSDEGRVVGYQMLLPSLVDRKDSKGIPIDHYVYRDGDSEIKIHKNNIIELRYPDPSGNMTGYPIISSVADQSEVNRLQMAYAKKFFEQGGFLGLAFSTNQQMTKSAFQRTLDLLENRYKGIDNAYQVGLFDSGLQPIKSAYSLREMDFSENRNLTREDIFAAFKVSKILVGMGESINRATAEASIYQFTSGTIDPVLNYVDQVLTKDFRKEYGEQYYVRHDTLAPKDQEGALAYYSKGLKEGWLTINEVRQAEDWNKLEGELADISTINVGGALISVDTGKQIATEIVADNNSNNMNFKKKDSSDDLLWKRFNRRHDLMSRKFSKNIFGYIDDQQRRILEAVKDNFIAEQAFNLEDENMLLYQLLEIDLWDIMKEGYKYGAMMYDIPYTSFNQDVMANDFNKIAKNALLLNETTLKELSNVSDESSLKSVTDGIKTRGQLLVTTSVTGSLNAGLLRAMIDAGLTKKRWLTMRDSAVRRAEGTHLEDHVIMDGVTVDINDTFKLTNRAGGFDECMYPGEPSLSPENLINDRCTIVGEK